MVWVIFLSEYIKCTHFFKSEIKISVDFDADVQDLGFE